MRGGWVVEGLMKKIGKIAGRERLYVETSVISFLTSRETRDLIVTARQQITRKWWEFVPVRYEAFISPYVIDEISQGDKAAAARRIKTVESLELLSVSREMETLSNEYFHKMVIPEKARYDSLHLACAVISGMDIIVSWNFKHIANPNTRRVLREINDKHGLVTPEISTPEEMMGDE
jgi:hypothetical protein